MEKFSVFLLDQLFCIYVFSFSLVVVFSSALTVYIYKEIDTCVFFTMFLHLFNGTLCILIDACFKLHGALLLYCFTHVHFFVGLHPFQPAGLSSEIICPPAPPLKNFL